MSQGMSNGQYSQSNQNSQTNLMQNTFLAPSNRQTTQQPLFGPSQPPISDSRSTSVGTMNRKKKK